MKLQQAMLVKLRGGALIGATVALGISWSFALVHIKTGALPLLWAAAMPLLAFYYLSGPPRAAWKHLPAAALSIYALVLWRVSSGYGAIGGVATALGVASSLAVFWLAARLHTGTAAGSAAPIVVPLATSSRRGNAAKRRRLRAAGGRR
ncbi:MAG TPA: hypothetical protein VKV26_02460 [Dehalococcoidia bacterium]|nr:hypothetical protein [Dehalococcoidia bacterium]